MTAAHPPNCAGTDEQYPHLDEQGCCACACPACSTRDGAGELAACICPDCAGDPTCGLHDERTTG